MARKRIFFRWRDRARESVQVFENGGVLSAEEASAARAKIGEMNFFEWLQWFFSEYGDEIFAIFIRLLFGGL